MSELALFGGKGVVAASEWVSWPIVSDDERKAVLEVLDRGILSGLHAPATRAFEAEFAAAVGAKHALLTHCGTSALQLAVAAENIGVARFASDDPYTMLKSQRFGTSFNLDGIWGGNMYAGGAGAILPNKVT